MFALIDFDLWRDYLLIDVGDKISQYYSSYNEGNDLLISKKMCATYNIQ